MLWVCNGIKCKEKYEPFFNAYENSAKNHNFFGLDIDKAEFDAFKEWYSYQTLDQIKEQVLFRRSFVRTVENDDKSPYYEAMQMAIEIQKTIFEQN